MNKPEPDAQGNGGVSEESHPAVDFGQRVQAVAPNFISQAQRLEHTTDSVGEVHAQEISTYDIKNRNERVGKPGDHHVVNVVNDEWVPIAIDLGFPMMHQWHFSWILRSVIGHDRVIVFVPWNGSHRVMQQVENKKAKNDQSGHDHGP